MAVPAATDHANTFQATQMRVTSLNANSTLFTGSGGCWNTNQFVSVGFTPTYIAGADASQLAADGSLCLDYKSPDILRYVALTVTICNPEPELRNLIAGGEVFSPGGAAPATGYGAPLHGVIPVPNGNALECWSRAVVNGKQAASNPYWYWVFPYTQLWPTGETTLQNGLPAIVFTGYGYGNSGFGAAIDGGWPYGSDRAYQFARAATQPSILNGFLS